MRIVQACPYSWDAPGGVQVHVRQLAEHLRGRGHEVLVIAPGERRANRPGLLIAGRPVRIPYNGSVAPISPWPSTLRAVGAALAEFEPELVHVHEPFAPSVSLAAVLRSKAPVVATFHAYAERSRLRDVAAPALRRVWRRLDVRIAVSEAAASFAGRGMGDGMVMVPNGVDVGLFRDARPAGGLPEGRRRVAMLGHVPHDDLPAYSAACEVFVGPARGGESFGIVLVEAMAAGLPVVASDIPGYREGVRDGEDGPLVPPSDPVALAAAVRTVLDDPTLAARLVRAGRARAEEFSWDTVVARLEALYEQVVR